VHCYTDRLKKRGTGEWIRKGGKREIRDDRDEKIGSRTVGPPIWIDKLRGESRRKETLWKLPIARGTRGEKRKRRGSP